MTNSTLHREIETRLGESQIRYTRGRRTVVTALSDAEGPLSAAELHSHLGPSLPLSSLYRTLAVLEEAGVLIHHFGQKGVTRYELAEWLSGHHHHLVCTSCGGVDDVELPSGVEEKVSELVDQIGVLSSFRPSDHSLEIEGLCSKCL